MEYTRKTTVILLIGLCLAAVYGHPSLEAGRRLLGVREWRFDGEVDESTVSCVHGHYPPPFCTATNVALKHDTKHFIVYSKDADVEFANQYLFRVSAEPRDNFPECHQTIEEAYVFTFYFYHGHSNYFHLHKDTLFPIFLLLRQRTSDTPVVLMPVVELRRMAEVDWDSGAFSEKHLDKYFIQTLKTLAGTDNAILPLDSDLIKASPHGHTCFRKAFIGAPSLRSVERSPSFMSDFVEFMMARLDVQPGHPGTPLVGIIKRAGRRKILNEDELVTACSRFVQTELVEFSGMSVREQVSAVQKYTVLVGMNGAGFMNAIYLPKGAVSIQLAPYNATQLNVKEFGEIVGSRGPYLFWRNEHSDLTRPVPGDVFNSQANTLVHVSEFEALVQQALALGVNKDLWTPESERKTEL